MEFGILDNFACLGAFSALMCFVILTLLLAVGNRVWLFGYFGAWVFCGLGNLAIWCWDCDVWVAIRQDFWVNLDFCGFS